MILRGTGMAKSDDPLDAVSMSAVFAMYRVDQKPGRPDPVDELPNNLLQFIVAGAMEGDKSVRDLLEPVTASRFMCKHVTRILGCNISSWNVELTDRALELGSRLLLTAHRRCESDAPWGGAFSGRVTVISHVKLIKEVVTSLRADPSPANFAFVSTKIDFCSEDGALRGPGHWEGARILASMVPGLVDPGAEPCGETCVYHAPTDLMYPAPRTRFKDSSVCPACMLLRKESPWEGVFLDVGGPDGRMPWETGDEEGEEADAPPRKRQKCAARRIVLRVDCGDEVSRMRAALRSASSRSAEWIERHDTGGNMQMDEARELMLTTARSEGPSRALEWIVRDRDEQVSEMRKSIGEARDLLSEFMACQK